MLAAAGSCNFTIAFSTQRIISAYIYPDLISCDCIRTTEIESIPQDSFRLPCLYIFQLLGKPVGVGSSRECFIGKNSRSSMMSMATFTRSRETRNYYIRLKFPDHPNHIA